MRGTHGETTAHIFPLHKQRRSRMTLVSWQRHYFSSLELPSRIWSILLPGFVLKVGAELGKAVSHWFISVCRLTLLRRTWLLIEVVRKTGFLLIIGEYSWKINMGFRLMNGCTANQMSYACVISKRDIWLKSCQINFNFELWVSNLWYILGMRGLLKVCNRGGACIETCWKEFWTMNAVMENMFCS